MTKPLSFAVLEPSLVENFANKWAYKMPSPFLYAPEGFIALDENTKNEICNGIGPQVRIIGIEIPFPQTIWGLNVSPCGDIHDYMYKVGTTKVAKDIADRVLLNNLLRMISAVNETSWKWVQNCRRIRAYEYYELCQRFGGPSFWAEKNPDEQLYWETEPFHGL